MKKKWFYLVALICSMSLFVACGEDEVLSDDDGDTTVVSGDDETTESDDETTEPDLETIISESIDGTYDGTLTLSLFGVQMSSESKTVTVVKGDGESVTISFSLNILGVFDYNFNMNCPITEEGNYYLFADSTSIDNGMVTATMSVTGSFVVEEGSTSLSMTVEAPDVDYSGTSYSITIGYEGTRSDEGE